jgi:hypothetical protein
MVLILLGCAAPGMNREQIAFVGCPADGQAGSLEPPRGVSRVVTLSKVDADDISYYKGAQGRGVFAPADGTAKLDTTLREPL